ncbi:hypothetical protein PLA106_14656, partial [Pseudomonas amygdali pv. lachrymans str. M302278]
MLCAPVKTASNAELSDQPVKARAQFGKTARGLR